MVRRITNSVQRTLPYDDRDVAVEPGAITEADLKQIPQKGDSIILAAAASTESAVEAISRRRAQSLPFLPMRQLIAKSGAPGQPANGVPTLDSDLISVLLPRP